MKKLEKRLSDLEQKRAKRWEPLNIQWIDTEAGEKMVPPEPGALVIYWGAGDDIGSYIYDPTKPNGGRPIKTRKSKGGKKDND